MPQKCTICHHPKLREITTDLMGGAVSQRQLCTRYGVSRPAIERHVKNHITKALRKLTAAEGMSLSEAAAIAEPVLMEMRKLNFRTLRILQAAEADEDHGLSLAAIREMRRNLELIAKLTGELDPRSAGEMPGSPMNITITYVAKQGIVHPAPPSGPQLLTDGGA